jgi:hypothetical protein
MYGNFSKMLYFFDGCGESAAVDFGRRSGAVAGNTLAVNP